MTGPTQDNSSLSVMTPLGKDALILIEMTGEEYVSDLFEFRLTMSADAMDLDLSALIGQPVTVTLTGPDGAKRYVNGICGRATQSGRTYHAELRPWPWLMTFTTDSRIFQNKNAPDIIKAVFGELGFTDFKDSLTATYEVREYCVQYQETYFDFVCRLMEEEGIYYFFTHEDGKHTMVLADDASAHVDIPVKATVPFNPVPTGKEWIDVDRVEDFVLEHRVVSGKYQADDFNFETPSTELKAQVTGAAAKFQIYEYPGNYLKKNLGDAFAKVRMAELEAPAKRVSGSGRVRGFAAGLKFTLEKHPRADLNAAYVLHTVSHEVRRREYANAFTAYPADAVFRPPRRTPRPRIVSTQTAIVTGKAGEEIWTDKHGRIKVQFHWDQLGTKDENSSCWIRVSQGWAGKNWGAIFLPRIGQEVIVSFLEGDPDRPIVTGCVYNGEQPVPYALPGEQTKSTVKSNSSKGGGGFNEIRFEDKKDSEEVFVQAQKDMTVTILNDRTETITNKRTTTIKESDDLLTLDKGSRTVTITEGNHTLTVTKGDRTVAVDTGKETHTVKGTRSVTVTGDETHTNEAAFTHNVTGNFTLKVDGNVTIEAGGSLTLKSGTAFSIEAGTALTAKASTDATIEGLNTTVKSSANLTVQAGAMLEAKGSAMGKIDGGGMLELKGGLVKVN
ncbi:type VI secretion system Vgr family protein [Arenibaculum sp.]|jgi:type VI secretion system secreted protein VgrG|uniref:type VI secretion system Vgr family protein n=1 Tax=Arenibaculum sp. TaxID=2865862 RepID=UPI002E15C983|nr:type VI secretion system tip protein TssI/VgrG [Arenibaculum sp.]